MARLGKVLDHFGSARLSALNDLTCQEYAARRGHLQAARRELEDLRAAVRYHWQQGLCSMLTPVTLPDRSVSRERWLTRSEAARMLITAWRKRQQFRGADTDRYIWRHVARFILVALYTGTRAGAICGAALSPTEGRGWIDLDRGIFYRRAIGRRETKKRQTPVRIPPRLLAHLRRWKALGISRESAVEWNGAPVGRINKAFRSIRVAAGLGPDVMPHTLRHTCATWLAHRGVPIWEAAGFVGMTAAQFERTYGHHHPDFQASAVNAFGRSKESAERSTVVPMFDVAKRVS